MYIPLISYTWLLMAAGVWQTHSFPVSCL